MKKLYKIYSRIWDNDSKSFSSSIKKISLISISIGLFSVITSLFVLDGFKEAISNKVYDFSGHYNLSNFSNGLSFRNSPIDLNNGYTILSQVPGGIVDSMITKVSSEIFSAIS